MSTFVGIDPGNTNSVVARTKSQGRNCVPFNVIEIQETMMSKLTPDLTAEINRRLVAEFDPDQIILFGSHAWGMPGQDSDVDLLVIVPETDERPTTRAVRAHRCLRGMPLPMDLIVRSRDEMARSARVSTSLEAEILDRGKVLYGRSEVGTGEQLAPQGVA